MNFCDINPFVRFAEYIYHNRPNGHSVFIKDCRIFYTISGKADMFIENQHYELFPNSLLYCAAGSIYKIQSSGAKLISLNFDLTQKDNFHTEYYPRISIQKNKPVPSIDWETVNDCEFLNSHLFLMNADDVLEPLKKIMREFYTQAMTVWQMWYVAKIPMFYMVKNIFMKKFSDFVLKFLPTPFSRQILWEQRCFTVRPENLSVKVTERWYSIYTAVPAPLPS